MNLSGFRLETVSSSSAGEVINLKGPATTGAAIAVFSGATGNYDIVVGYHDENDGSAQISVRLASSVLDSWSLNLNLGGSHANAGNALTRQVASAYPVANGDSIELTAIQGNWDNANIDYIEFVPTNP